MPLPPSMQQVGARCPAWLHHAQYSKRLAAPPAKAVQVPAAAAVPDRHTRACPGHAGSWLSTVCNPPCPGQQRLLWTEERVGMQTHLLLPLLQKRQSLPHPSLQAEQGSYHPAAAGLAGGL